VYGLINDNIVGSVIFFASLMTGLIGAGVAAILAREAWNLAPWGIWALVG
jgi:hypothetical protein